MPARVRKRVAARTPGGTRPVSLAATLRSGRGFGFFWAGYCATVIGDAITRTTLIWYVFEATGSSVSVGLLSFCFTAPVIVGGLLAGWLLDRFDRRAVIALDSLAKGLFIIAVPLLAAFDLLPLWLVYAVASLFGLLMMVPLAGVPSLIPSLVRAEQLNSANALETIGFTVGGVVGPPLAGAIIALVGPLDALYLDALSYAVFAWTVWRCSPAAEPAADDDAVRPGAGLRGAARLIFRNPVLLTTTLMYLGFNLGLGALLVMLPVYAASLPGGGPALFGLLMAAIAIGELVGSVAAGHLRLPVAVGLAICIAMLASGASLVFLGAVPSIFAALAGLALYGLFSAPLTIWGQTLRMKIIPAHYRGRCFAIMRTLMQSGGPLGGLGAGFALPLVGITAAIAGIAGLTCAIAGYGLSVRPLRRAR